MSLIKRVTWGMIYNNTRAFYTRNLSHNFGFKITLKCEKSSHLQQINVVDRDKRKINFMLHFIASSHIADNQTNGVKSRHPTKNETELKMWCLLIGRVEFGRGLGLNSEERILTFRGPCIVIYSYDKTKEMY